MKIVQTVQNGEQTVKIVTHTCKKPKYAYTGTWSHDLSAAAAVMHGKRYMHEDVINTRWIIMRCRRAILSGCLLTIDQKEDELNRLEARTNQSFSVDHANRAQLRLGRFPISHFLDWLQWEMSYWIANGEVPKHTDHIAEDPR